MDHSGVNGRRRIPISSLQSPFGMCGSRFWAAVLPVLLAVCFVSSVPTYAQSAVCERALVAAQDQYREAEYDEALRLAAACLNQEDRTADQAISAYRILALIHLKRDELEQARSAVVNLLGIDPTYTTDPVADPPAYVSLVSIVQRDVQGPTEAASSTPESTRPSFFRRTSTWVTMGTVLVGSGVATVVALQSGSGGEQGGGGGPPPPGPEPLPIPPTTP